MDWHRTRIPTALLLLIAAGAGVWKWRAEAHREAAEQAVFLDLDSRFTAAETRSRQLNAEFRLLLQSSSGEDLVRRIAAKHDVVAFYEPRKTVYFAHERRSGPGWKSCIGIVGVQAGDRIDGHSGMLHQLAVEALSIDGDELRVRCRTSTDPEDLFFLTKMGFSPGGLCDARIDLASKKGGYPSIGPLRMERFHPVDG